MSCVFILCKFISSMLTYVSKKHERHKPGQHLSIYCIFQDLTHPSLTGHFQSKVRNYGIVYPLILETALLSWYLYFVALFPVIYGNENVRCYVI